MPCLAIGPLTRFGLTGGQEILWKPAKRVLKAAAASNMDVLVSSASRSMVLGRPRSSQPCSAMTRSAATCSGELQNPTAESQRRTCLCPWGTCESWCVTFKARPGPVLFHFAALFILTVTSQLHFWHELSEANELEDMESISCCRYLEDVEELQSSAASRFLKRLGRATGKPGRRSMALTETTRFIPGTKTAVFFTTRQLRNDIFGLRRGRVGEPKRPFSLLLVN